MMASIPWITSNNIQPSRIILLNILDAIPVPKRDMVAKCAVYVNVYLIDVGRVRQPRFELLYLINVEC